MVPIPAETSSFRGGSADKGGKNMIPVPGAIMVPVTLVDRGPFFFPIREISLAGVPLSAGFPRFGAWCSFLAWIAGAACRIGVWCLPHS